MPKKQVKKNNRVGRLVRVEVHDHCTYEKTSIDRIVLSDILKLTVYGKIVAETNDTLYIEYIGSNDQSSRSSFAAVKAAILKVTYLK